MNVERAARRLRRHLGAKADKARRQVNETPMAPQNVRITMADGSTIPVEVIYKGKFDGQHLWVASYPIAGNPTGLLIDMLPPKTSIGLSVELRNADEPST